MTPDDVLAALAVAPPPTHRRLDFTHSMWGHAAYYRPQNGGLTVTGHLIVGESPQLGDWLLLPNGEKTTRYRITELRWMCDPEDMWQFTATFDPRTAEVGTGGTE